MDLKDVKTYDCQVADFNVNRKKVKLTQTDVEYILAMIEQHSNEHNAKQGNRKQCKEWVINDLPDNTAMADELDERKGQVIDFREKKPMPKYPNGNNPERGLQPKGEQEMKKHFLEIDQKLRKISQPEKKGLLAKVEHVFSKFIKKNMD